MISRRKEGDMVFGPLVRKRVLFRSGEGEEALAKRLQEAQFEVAALKLERDALKRLLRDRDSADGKAIEPGI
jgi:hypothetical protein